MRIVLTLLCSLTCLTLAAQQPPHIELMLGGGAAKAHFRYGGSDPTLQHVRDANRNHTRTATQSAAGITYLRYLTERTALRTGLQISSLGQRTVMDYPATPEDLLFGPEPGTRFPQRITLTRHYRYMTVPVVLRREGGPGRLVPFVEAGLQPGYYLHTRLRTRDDRGTSETTARRESDMRNFRLGALIAVGARYAVVGNWHVVARPVLHYQLLKTHRGSVAEHPYGLRLEVGLMHPLD